jgi:hypothetical protein
MGNMGDEDGKIGILGRYTGQMGPHDKQKTGV